MPVLASTGPPAVTDLAGRLVSDLSAGRVARQSFGSRTVAFEWSVGLPMILARVVSSAVVDGLTYNATRVKASATPATKVARGATKPDAVTITQDTENLQKYAGLANFQTEHALETDGLTAALANVITSSCLMAYDADCAAILTAEAGLTPAAAAAWPAAILGGIAAVGGAGGAPGVLAIGAGDYASVVQSPGTGYAMNPSDGIPAMFGLRIVLLSGVTAGTGFVIDPASCIATENASSPSAIVDPYSGLTTNAVRCAVEAFMGFTVANPGGVAKVSTGGVTATTATPPKSGKKSDYGLGA